MQPWLGPQKGSASVLGPVDSAPGLMLPEGRAQPPDREERPAPRVVAAR